jgi:hypothetical protein
MAEMPEYLRLKCPVCKLLTEGDDQYHPQCWKMIKDDVLEYERVIKSELTAGLNANAPVSWYRPRV